MSDPHGHGQEPGAARRFALLAVAAAGFWLIKNRLPLDEATLAAHQLKAEAVRGGAAVLFAAAFLWLTEALPLAATALLVPLLGVLGAGAGLEPSLACFADPIIFLFLGGFLLAAALHEHRLDAWLAARIVVLGGGRFVPAALMLIVATAFVSMWISNTATAAMMLPLALGLVHSLEGDEGERRRAEIFLLLGICFAASVGGVGSIAGTPPNGIAARQLGLDFTGWFRYGLPTLAVWLPALVGILWLLFRPSWSWRVPLKKAGGPWTAHQWTTAAIFTLTVLAWLCSSQLASLVGLKKGFDSLIVLGSIALIFMTGSLGWKQAEKHVEWGVLLLFGGGLCLGKILEDTGCSLYLARWFTEATHGWPLPLLLLALGTVITLLSEVASNTAVATLMVPIFAKVAVEMGLPPEKLVIPVALASSCGFMLPVATPPNALIYATGRVPHRHMIRAGGLLDVACVLLMTLLAVWVF